MAATTLLTTSLAMLATLHLALSASDTGDRGWKSFKDKFGKKYDDTKNDGFRRAIREVRLQAIRAHNENAKAGLFKFRMAENQLTDMTPAEYRKLLGYKAPPTGGAGSRRRRRQIYVPAMPIYTSTVSTSTLPTKVNWTEAGWDGPVLDQGYYCGSCYAYTSAASISSQLRNKTGSFVQLSPQNIIDCSSEDEGNFGCNGGSPQASFWYVKKNGLESLADYPETSVETGSAANCAFDSASSKTSVTSWRDVAVDEAALMQAVAQVGPVAAVIDASADGYQSYYDGVYSDTDCSSDPDYMNHAILVVGYGRTADGVDYWLCKNSWGTYWGMNGYFMLERNKNMCGIANAAAFPVIE
jgi:C1A family cysteine protease